ncbi:MAG: hypothetical protein F6K04_22440, partial [Leptolyngbya sp. SIO4C5]|nr:hypothetical protein [Leptolyngbya sp. SIO4C5]
YVNDLIDNIIATELSNAKAEVANGRQQVQDYVAQLPQDLQSVGQEAATSIQSEFDSLEQSVDDKQNELIDSLANKYNERLQAVDARIAELKEANKGLVSKAQDAMTGVIGTINKLKNMLMSVLKGAASAVTGIIKDPIGFLGNLISGIKQGFDNFVGNIWEHLQGGLVGWLTGAMGAVGIQIPDDLFSLSGIFDLVAQILGMTWNYVRTKAVKFMGEPVLAAAEKSFEVFTLLQEKGPLGLWDYVQDQFTDLKETVMDEIKNMVIVQAIQAGVKWILGLLNPASAFVKACMLIYDIIMFFVNQGSQVMSLMKAVIDGVKAIAGGAVGAVAKAIEGALVKSLPVVIGFLASIAGVGGLAGKVQKIVKKIRGRIDKAIDKVLVKAKKLFKGKKGKNNKNSVPSDKKERLKKAVAETDTLIKQTHDFEEVRKNLPIIKSKYQLKELELVRDKKYKYHVKAKINPTLNGPPGVLFTDAEIKELETVAKQYAKQINQKGHKDLFLANPKEYLTGDPTKKKAPKVKIGDTVEAAGTPGVEELATEAGLTVLKTVELKFVKQSGDDIRSQIPELDFLILSNAHLKEIVSAKMKPKQFKVKQDKKLLRHFLEMPLNPPDVITYAKTHFGRNKAYDEIDHVDVLYIQESNRHRTSLVNFRSQHLSRVSVDTIEITPLTPAPESDRGIQLRATEAELVEKTVELVKQNL